MHAEPHNDVKITRINHLVFRISYFGRVGFWRAICEIALDRMLSNVFSKVVAAWLAIVAF